MAQLRRGYVYGIGAIVLAVVAVAAVNLLEIASIYLLEQITGNRYFESSAADVRQRLSLFLALVGVATPLLLFHSWLAERWAAADLVESDRGSRIRSLYFFVVLGFSLMVFAFTLTSIIDSTISRALGERFAVSIPDGVSAGAMLLAAGGIWSVHLWARNRDVNLMRLPESSLVPDRVYRYGAIAISALFFLTGLAELLVIALESLVEQRSSVFNAQWVAYPVAQTLVSGLILSLHAVYSHRMHLFAGWIGESERHSSIRRSTHFGLAFVSIAVALVALGLGVGQLLPPLLGPEVTADETAFLNRLFAPLLWSVAFAAFWWIQRRYDLAEAGRFAAPEHQVSVARVHSYVLGFVGFVIGAIGLGYLAGVTFEFMFGAVGWLDIGAEWFPNQLATFVAFVVVGAPIWIVHWRLQRRAIEASPMVERRRTVRRAYLYLVIGFSTLALLASLSTLLYQVFQMVLEVRSTAAWAGDEAALLGIAFVAASALAFHLVALRQDLRFAQRVADPTSSIEALVSFRLTGPADAPMVDVVESWLSSLPESMKASDLRIELTVIEPEMSGDIESNSPSDTPNLGGPKVQSAPSTGTIG